MQSGVPEVLSRLLTASDDGKRGDAWAAFLDAYSPLVLTVIRTMNREHDDAMNAFTFVIDALRADDHRRLRAYVPSPGARFTTWLAVTTRRLALDHLRQRYGRSRSNDETRRNEQAGRWRLENLIAEELDGNRIAAQDGATPDLDIRRAQLTAALRDALEGLDPADRLLLVLRYVDERPVRDIARVLRAPTVFHVYRRTAALLARLRVALARQGVESPEP